MGLKMAVIAGGAFEAERSLAAANDVIAALKEAEHEPELFRRTAPSSMICCARSPMRPSAACAAATANPATSRTRSPR